VALDVKTLLCTLLIAATFSHSDRMLLAIKHPAAASDLRMFYRSIRALSADPVLNGSAVAAV